MIIGLIGCGVMGRRIAEELNDNVAVDRILVFDYNQEKVKDLDLKKAEPADANRILDECDLIVESASREAVRQMIPEAVARGIHVMVLSIGALLDERLVKSVIERSRETGSKIYLPSGAICGVDAIKAAVEGEVWTFELTTVKHPRSLQVTDEFTEEAGIDITSLTDKTLIFEGTPEDAVRYFPRNLNVSATLTLSARGKITPLVRVYLDPGMESNKHIIKMEGEFGSLDLELDNVPSPDNPKTSHLAVLSAVATLRQILDTLRLGT